MCGVGVDRAMRTCWSFCACAGGAMRRPTKKVSDARAAITVFTKETSGRVLVVMRELEKSTRYQDTDAIESGLGDTLAHRPLSKNQIRKEQN